MSLHDVSFTPQVRDLCPVCRGVTKLALVEPHPGRDGLEIHTFRCAECGPTISRIIALHIDERPNHLAACLPEAA